VSSEQGNVTFGEVTRVYSFGRFLKERWWFVLLVLAKLSRAGGGIDNGTLFLLAAIVLGVWYFLVLDAKAQEARKQETRPNAAPKE
jgi:hypothetical protein